MWFRDGWLLDISMVKRLSKADIIMVDGIHWKKTQLSCFKKISPSWCPFRDKCIYPRIPPWLWNQVRMTKLRKFSDHLIIVQNLPFVIEIKLTSKIPNQYSKQSYIPWEWNYWTRTGKYTHGILIITTNRW